MKGCIILCILTVIIFSCTINFKIVNGRIPLSNNEPKCNALYNFIKNNWSQNNKYHCFYYNEKLIKEMQKIENYTCFKGLSTNEIIELFGKPTSISNDNINYSVGKVCGEGEYPSIYSLKFSINDDKVSNMQFSKIIEE